jgi:hypothetical protein
VLLVAAKYLTFRRDAAQQNCPEQAQEKANVWQKGA